MYGFGSAGRKEGTGSFTPGPGTYQANGGPIKSAGPMHSMTPRRERPARSFTPGPGQYRSGSAPHATKSPEYGFGSAPRAKDGASGNPGPGAYAGATPPGAAGPAFSMPARRSATSRPTTPGPGAYKHTGGETNTPRWAFGSAGRNEEARSATPGPGAYAAATDSSGPGFSMAPRRGAAERSNTPGPGSYKQDAAGADGLAAPKWGFGKSERTGKMASDGPGPGTYQYHTSLGNDGPKYSVRGRRGSKNNKPGDGMIGVPYTQFGY